MNNFYTEEQHIPITESPRMNDHLGKDTYKTPEAAIEELIQNSYDAKATIIRIKIDENEISFSDNGRGFDKESVIAFTIKGSDYKLNKKTNLGNKGIGRLAIFKLANTFEVLTRHKKYHPIAQGIFWKVEKKNFVAGKGFLDTKPYPWKKEEISGTEFILYNLTREGKLLSKRLNELRKNIAMNWDLDKTKIYVNGYLVEAEDIKYESGYFKKIERNLSGCGYVEGKIGLTSIEGNISGITIKVKTRGVGEPRYFGIEMSSRYGMFLSRIRGVLRVDSLEDIINISRDDFNRTDNKYLTLSKFVKEELIKILEKRLKQQEKDKNKKLNTQLKKYLRDFVQKILSEILDPHKGAFKKPLTGDANEGNEEEVFIGIEGDSRDTPHDKDGKPKRKAGDLKDNMDIDNKAGKLKIKNNTWYPEVKSMGSDEKFIVPDLTSLKVFINNDHPAFRIYNLPKNLPFLAIEIIYAISLTTNELTKGETREIIDRILRKISK